MRKIEALPVRENCEPTPLEKTRALVHHLFAHPTRVANLVTTFVFANDLAEKKDLLKIFVASFAHDFGKLFMKNGMHLISKNGSLRPAERLEMKEHPTYSYNFFVKLGLTKIAEIVFEHHEKWDSSGYPQGLKEEEINFFSRILKIADVFDAITSHRGYDPAQSINSALVELRAKSGTDFDPVLVEPFCEFVERNRQLVALLLLNSLGAKSERNFDELKLCPN